MFNESDFKYMKMALGEAKISFQRGDLPVGAVLTIDEKLIGRGGNCANTLDKWSSHAEFIVLDMFSRTLKNKEKSSVSTLYTTWEPCLMCLSISRMNRLDRIVYACPDPIGGATKLNPSKIGEWYTKKWSKIEHGIYKEESFNMLVKYCIVALSGLLIIGNCLLYNFIKVGEDNIYLHGLSHTHFPV